MDEIDFIPLRLVLQPSGYGVDLAKPDVLLGRHSQADIRLPLPDVSRRHCRFLFEDGQWRVIDLDSLNGIYVNGERLLRAELQEGDVIAIGGFTFEVNLHSNQAANPDGADTNDYQTAILRSIVEALPPQEQDVKPVCRKAS
jgi:pSer/pThr/pTyr-binding forkhead associated (FHA) protein